jgi:hypothetical protein
MNLRFFRYVFGQYFRDFIKLAEIFNVTDGFHQIGPKFLMLRTDFIKFGRNFYAKTYSIITLTPGAGLALAIISFDKRHFECSARKGQNITLKETRLATTGFTG